MTLVDVRTLREPPVPGRYYLVPTIHYVWSHIVRDWPVAGPMHTDLEIGFPDIHWHVDPRFLPKSLAWRDKPSAWHRASEVNGRPISENERTIPHFGLMPRQPTLKKLRCRTDKHVWLLGQPPEQWGFERIYGLPADAIQRPDGRQLCPHRSFDLSQTPADPDGIVVCPLHGLRVKCLRDASSQDAGASRQLETTHA